MATHSSILAWGVPWAEEPGRLQSIGLQKVRHDRSDLVHMYALVYTMSIIIISQFNLHKYCFTICFILTIIF